MTSGEDRTATFVLTAVATGCLTESVTRTISLMRFTPSSILCLVLGVISLGFLLMQMGLGSD